MVIRRLRGEVDSGRAEAVLSRPVTRDGWLLAYVTAAAIGAAALMFAFGLGIALATLGSAPGEFFPVAAAGVVRAPAPWLFIALTSVFLATLPRAAAPVGFTVVGAFQALEFAVEFRLLPKGALEVSPFALVPQLPGGAVHPWQTIVLLVIAAVLGGIASRAIQRQDIH